jgi:transcriptional regulator with XRE-family HTH domain
MLVNDVPGMLRRGRRMAKLSQRELAAPAGVSTSTVAHIESRRLVPSLRTLISLLDAAGLTLQVVDRDGSVVPTYDGDGLRDRADRLYPAHLDVREVGPRGEGWWGRNNVMPWIREMPTHTFDRRL